MELNITFPAHFDWDCSQFFIEGILLLDEEDKFDLFREEDSPRLFKEELLSWIKRWNHLV